MSQDNRTDLELATEGLVRGSDGNVYPMPDTGQAPYDPVTDFIGTIALPIAAGFTGSAIGITGLLGAAGKGLFGGGAVKGAGGAGVGGGVARGVGRGLFGGGIGGFLGRQLGRSLVGSFFGGDDKDKKKKKKTEQTQETPTPQQTVVPTQNIIPVKKSNVVNDASSVSDVSPTIVTGTATFSDIIKQCVTIDEQVAAINEVVQISYNNKKKNEKSITRREELIDFKEREKSAETKSLSNIPLIGGKLSQVKSNTESGIKDFLTNLSLAIGTAAVVPMIESYKEEPLRIVRDGFRILTKQVSRTFYNVVEAIGKFALRKFNRVVEPSVRAAGNAARAGVAPVSPQSGRIIDPKTGRPYPPSVRGTSPGRAPSVPPKASTQAAQAAARNNAAKAALGSKVAPTNAIVKSPLLTGKGVERFTRMTGFLKRIPIIGSLIGIGIDLALGVPLDSAIVGAIGYSLGYSLGSIAGKGIGFAVGSIFPVIGNAIGAVAGSFIGGIIGGYIGEQLAKSLWSSVRGVSSELGDVEGSEESVPEGSTSPVSRRPGTFVNMTDENGNRILGVYIDENTVRPATPEEIESYRETGANNADGSGTRTYSPTGIQKEMYDYLVNEKGLSRDQAMGILANINRESSFQVNARSGDDGGAGGLFQWKEPRSSAMERAVPDWETNWKGQIDYALREPGEPGPEYMSTQFTSAQEAADWWMRRWERPSDTVSGSRKHAEYLESVPTHFGTEVQVTPSQSMSNLPPLPPTGTLGTGAQAYGASRGGGSRSHAGVDFDISGNESFYTRLGGKVVNIGYDPGGYGNYVDILTPQGVIERIAEGAEVLVSMGQELKPGDAVVRGETNTGVIHYEIRNDGGGFGYSGTVDPIKYLEQVESDYQRNEGTGRDGTFGDGTYGQGRPSGKPASKLMPVSDSLQKPDSSSVAQAVDILSKYSEETENIVVPVPIPSMTSSGGGGGSKPSMSDAQKRTSSNRGYHTRKLISSLY